MQLATCLRWKNLLMNARGGGGCQTIAKLKGGFCEMEIGRNIGAVE